jgi:uncharacterized repeat protein (TIGR01451 family)
LPVLYQALHGAMTVHSESPVIAERDIRMNMRTMAILRHEGTRWSRKRCFMAVFLLTPFLALGGSAHASAATGPDLAVSLAVQFNPLNFGSNETFTATVTNTGTASAENVRLTDTLPVSCIAYLSSSTSQGICSATGHIVTCTFGAMAAGATATSAITVSQSEPVGSTVTNSASVQIFDANGNPVSDPTPADDSTNISVMVVSGLPPVKTDIQVAGSSNNGSPRAGTAFILTWQVKNDQDQTANGVTFTNSLPSDLTLEGISTTLGICNRSIGTAGATVNCSMDGLAKGQTQVISLNVSAGPALGNVSDTGSATFTGSDTNPANNTFTVTVKVQ